MQQELILRLLKSNKIAGYMKIALVKRVRRADACYVTHSLNNGIDIDKTMPPLLYNFFELGVKIGDETWFEGDRVYDKAREQEGVIVYNEMGWGIIFGNPDNVYTVHWCDYEHLGTIHEKTK